MERDGEEKSKEMCVNVGVGAERERLESGKGAEAFHAK